MRLARACTLALALAALVSLPVSAGSSPFRGAWMATDVDGSNLVLAIGGQPDALRMTMHDDYATLCGGGAAILHGTGTVAGASASVTFNVRCVNKTPLPDSPYTFTYDGTTDTLIDGYGLIWSRP